MRRIILSTVCILLAAAALTTCEIDSPMTEIIARQVDAASAGGDGDETFTVTYQGNGSDGGAVPVDGNDYAPGAEVTVSAPGTISRTGYTFIGWNTAQNGTGTSYEGGYTFSMPDEEVTLYAQWSVNQYTVSYEGNGSDSGTVPSSSEYDYGSQVTAATQGSLSRTEAAFVSWNTQSDGGGTPYNAGASFTMPASDVTLFAQWSVNQYTLTYDGNGSDGGAIPSGGDYTYDTQVTVANSGTMSRTGYTFIGWNTVFDGGGTPYLASATFSMPAYNVTLYAQWTTGDTYNVTYDGNGSDGGTVPEDVNNYIEGANVTVAGPGTMSLTGYNFFEWNTSSAGDQDGYAASGTLVMPANNVTLYAQWTISQYTLSFDANDGTGTMDDIPLYYDEATNLPANTFTRDGYYFTGWATEASGAGDTYNDGASYTMGIADEILYAQWSEIATFTVTYDGNGADGGTEPVDDNNYPENATVTVADPGTLSRTEATFVDWNTSSDGDGTPYAPSANFSMPDNNVTLFAQWSINHFTLSFHANGGTGTMDNIELEYDQTTTLPANTFTDNGNTFAGWATEPGGGGDTYADGASYTMGAGDEVLYAQWTVPQYIVSFHPNNGTGTMAEIELDYDETISLPPNTFTRTNYTFTGWATEAGGGGDTYTDEASYTMGAGNEILYAQWSADLYTLSYDGGDSDGGAVPSSQDYFSGDWVEVAEPGTMSRTDYRFVYWNTEADGSGTPYIGGEGFNMPAEDVTLYAQWDFPSGTQRTDTSGSVQFAQRYVSAGYYYVGIETGAYDYAGNTNVILTSGYWIAETEVTYELWYEVRIWAESHGYTFANPGREGNDGTDGDPPTAADQEPVAYINWRDAMIWCNALSEKQGLTPAYYTNSSLTIPIQAVTNNALDTTLGHEDNPYVDWDAGGYRLPTEAESEIASRGADIDSGYGTEWPGSDNIPPDDVAWTSSNSSSTSRNVAILGANELGLYDMGGNIYEWCWDWYKSSRSLGTDPKGPEYDGWPYRVRHGGSYYYSYNYSRVYGRDDWYPYSANPSNGFRLASSAPGDTGDTPTYTVTYDGNDSDGGSVPVDANNYAENATVTVADPGTMSRAGYSFEGWNTEPTGTGTSYAPTAAFAIPAIDVILYAQWSID